MTAIRVGVIGVGGMGACHARNVSALAGADLVWVADPAEDVGRSLAEELGSRWVADAMTVIDDVDALVIACPDRFHAKFVTAGLERTLPMLCEKPLTLELADAREIVDAEATLGRRLIQLGFMREYDERHVQVADAVAGLGPVNLVRAMHRNTNDGSRAVDDMLVESIIHDIHSVRWIAGTEIDEVLTSVVERDGATHTVLLTCRLANGGVAVIEFDDMATGYEVSLEVSAVDGNVVSSEPLRAAVRTNGHVSAEIGDDWFAPFLETYRIEMRDWLESVRVGEARGPSAWDGYAAQVVVDAASTSNASGSAAPVNLGQKPPIYEGSTL